MLLHATKQAFLGPSNTSEGFGPLERTVGRDHSSSLDDIWIVTTLEDNFRYYYYIRRQQYSTTHLRPLATMVPSTHVIVMAAWQPNNSFHSDPPALDEINKG